MSTPVQSPSSPSPLRLLPQDSLLLCVDIQQRLCAAMPKDGLAQLVRNAARLIEGAKVMGVPIIVSEQYRRGLGTTIPELASLFPSETPHFEKLEFSVWAAPEIATAIAASGRSQIIVMGMETHICVYQTVRDLLHVGYKVHVPHDAICSREPENARVGLVLAERAGAVVSATETVLFDWLHRAGTPEFKAISALVR